MRQHSLSSELNNFIQHEKLTLIFNFMHPSDWAQWSFHSDDLYLKCLFVCLHSLWVSLSVNIDADDYGYTKIMNARKGGMMTTMKIPFLVWIYEGGILISILCEFLLVLALNSPLSSSFQDYVIKIIKFIVCIFSLELCNKESVTFRQMMKTWLSDANSSPN